MIYNTSVLHSVFQDMNEPSNFVFGSTVGCTNSTEDKPPYTPGTRTLTKIKQFKGPINRDGNYRLSACPGQVKMEPDK